MILKEKHSQFNQRKSVEIWVSILRNFQSRFLEEEAPHLENWLKIIFIMKWKYMENHFDKRLNPTLLVEGAKSVISLSYNYFPAQQIENNSNFKISKYAYGEDYHEVIKILKI